MSIMTLERHEIGRTFPRHIERLLRELGKEQCTMLEKTALDNLVLDAYRAGALDYDQLIWRCPSLTWHAIRKNMGDKVDKLFSAFGVERPTCGQTDALCALMEAAIRMGHSDLPEVVSIPMAYEDDEDDD